MLRTSLFLSFALVSATLVAQDSLPSSFLVRTKGNIPHLEYGIGDDRLGGAKMTFLDSLVLLNVVDSFGTDYKVQLSKSFAAYIDKKSVVRVSNYRPVFQQLSANCLVSGDSAFDYVSLSLGEKLPYRSVQQIGPSRIVLDVFGVASNTNWIIQKNSAKEIKNTYYEQVSDDVMRIYIELNHQQHWGYQVYYVGNRLTVKVKRQPAVNDLKYFSIAIDAGHGGDNNGADGVTTHILEKNYTLLMAKQLQLALQEKGACVYMTREKDTTLSIEERILGLRQANPNFLISIHLNSSGSELTSGVSTYYRYIGFRPLTQYVLQSMLELGLEEYGNVGNFNFGLNGPTDYPNCLVEVAFLSNRQDEKRILDPKFHQQVAQKIIKGIEEWLEEVYK